MEFEIRNGVYLPLVPEIKDKLANAPKYCARYARMVSSSLLIGKEDDKGKLWEIGDGWNYHYLNRSVWTKEKGALDFSELRRGQILGIRIPYSQFNDRRDDRNNNVRYSHLAAVLCHLYDGNRVNPWIAHNVYGVSDPESLPKFLRRTGSVVMEVFSPKDESVLEN
jgi:hypothetical protein